MTNPLIS